MAESKGIQYEYKLREADSDFYFDRDKLEKILTNLISNAIKFTPAGGNITILQDYLPGKGGKDPGYVKFLVTDSGDGIPENELEHIFERFYRISNTDKQKEEGTGIGLSLCKELITVYRGEILVESKREAILESASSSLGVKRVKAEQEQIQELCLEIRRLQHLCRQAKRRVESLTQCIDSVRNMSGVLGKMTAAVLYIVLGDMQKYSNAGSIVKTLGLNLKEHSSGRHKGQLRITKRGSGLARMYLYLAVLRLIQKDAVIKAWYQKKLQRDGKVKKKAIIAIMRKLASSLWYVGQGAKFDSSKLFDVNKLTFQSV